ncbi:5-oxoprolinase subunit PxpB [Paenibacillus sp. 5J-6]|uniref:5-oxoprolinase subunit PxpB n=1 Tax=Paenibacillus silvestris TaxID=2606219 RepID=A0A6L8V2I6_9BACL|nr:5-oxoprolinase subunit PxpB [Paenibacillus silvestris]MZQ84668.1 5-oxoprolinase subunit PxpB [Paenibacillus silvestris]
MTKLHYEWHHLGDSAIVLTLGTSIDLSTLDLVRQVTAYLEKYPFAGFIELVSAYTTITIYYDPVAVYEHFSDAEVHRKHEHPAGENYLLPCDKVLQHIQRCLDGFEMGNEKQSSQNEECIEIPVCYGGEFGPDLAAVAAYHSVTEEEIIARHTALVYPVYMIGFAPGFPYLGGMDKQLNTPRKAVPRPRIPAGSVGIGGAQTGIYPFETPGGWNLIGRTPLALFQPESAPPSLLRVGDRVKFIAITPEQFHFSAERNQGYGL